jgi:hypothetical protein
LEEKLTITESSIPSSYPQRNSMSMNKSSTNLRHPKEGIKEKRMSCNELYSKSLTNITFQEDASKVQPTYSIPNSNLDYEKVND